MKKFVTKIVTLALAFSLVFSVTSLAGCTRKLDDVEKSIVGDWDWYGMTETFYNDGTFNSIGTGSVKFKHKGDGTDAELGHYEIIIVGTGEIKRALFDSDKSRLYSIGTDNTINSNLYSTRK